MILTYDNMLLAMDSCMVNHQVSDEKRLVFDNILVAAVKRTTGTSSQHSPCLELDTRLNLNEN